MELFYSRNSEKMTRRKGQQKKKERLARRAEATKAARKSTKPTKKSKGCSLPHGRARTRVAGACSPLRRRRGSFRTSPQRTALVRANHFGSELRVALSRAQYFYSCSSPNRPMSPCSLLTLE